MTYVKSLMIRIVCSLILSLSMVFSGYTQDDRFLPDVDGERFDRENYTMIWNSELRLPKIITYELTKEELMGSSCSGARYHSDPDVNAYSNTDYEGAFDVGFEKGHLMPAAHGNWDEKSCLHTSYYSNISPQSTTLNRGVWNKCDNRIDSLAREKGRVYVHQGPIPIFLDSLPSGMPIPIGYWKTILYQDNGNWTKESYLFSQHPEEDYGFNHNVIDDLFIGVLLNFPLYNSENIEPIDCLHCTQIKGLYEYLFLEIYGQWYSEYAKASDPNPIYRKVSSYYPAISEFYDEGGDEKLIEALRVSSFAWNRDFIAEHRTHITMPFAERAWFTINEIAPYFFLFEEE